MSTEPRLASATPPTLRGALGEAWLYDIDEVLKVEKSTSLVQPPRELSLAGWLIRAPYAHPFWHSYFLALISLRDVPGWPQATINLAGATHEVMLFALNPDKPVELNRRPRLLTPANFVGQFIEASDEAAIARIRQTVQDVIDGRLNPDTDYTRWWINRFSASNIKGDPRAAGETRITVDAPGGERLLEVVIPPKPGPQDMN